MAAAARAFAVHVLRGRWFMAYGSFLIMSAAGATYIFAVYSKDIKATLGYTQEQLNTVGFFKDVGANVGKRFLFTRAEFGVSAAVVLAMLLVPFTVVLREEAALFKNTLEAQSVVPVPTKPRTPVQEPASVAERPAATLMSRVVRALRPPPLGDDYTILQALVSVDMLLLFTATVFGIGGTLTAIDNMGQIGESLGYPQRSIATFVSLISIWNYLGRVASGFASEALLARYRLPRPLVLAVVLLLTVPGHLLISFGVPGSLYVASVIIGFCFGAAQPLILASVSELFGLRYYSTLYNLCGTASPVGSYVLNVRVAGRMYDREAARQGGGHAVASAAGKRLVTCIGVRCYKESFLVITAVTVAAAAVTLVLAWRTRGFYAGDVYARFKEEEEEEAVVAGQSRNGVAASEMSS
ncbi:unnamed protein product [Triticum turgidum subsp. durum]|uniref:Nodulin-like domain-containing protein n=1 Tax=Triticum turgidum subsp. durum TaxID=4567 RepID=A0A9R0V4F2_TRITD|nr:unnamed protein product [Triticum turgidum subsp. durum]